MRKSPGGFQEQLRGAGGLEENEGYLIVFEPSALVYGVANA
jgi:hypothetical protein